MKRYLYLSQSRFLSLFIFKRVNKWSVERHREVVLSCLKSDECYSFHAIKQFHFCFQSIKIRLGFPASSL